MKKLYMWTGVKLFIDSSGADPSFFGQAFKKLDDIKKYAYQEYVEFGFDESEKPGKINWEIVDSSTRQTFLFDGQLQIVLSKVFINMDERR
jgi:hypothetical protein